MNMRFTAMGCALSSLPRWPSASAQQTTTAPRRVRGRPPWGGSGRRRGEPTPPPVQWSTPPAPIATMALDTGVQHMVWVVPTRGFNQPWSMAFLPDGGILVTERPGCLRIIRGGVLDPRHVTGLPAIQAAGLAGLMDIALHPQFAENQLVYFTYHKPAATTNVAALAPTGPCAPGKGRRGRRPRPARRQRCRAGRGAGGAGRQRSSAGAPDAGVAAAEAGKGRSRSRVDDGTGRRSST